MRLSITSLIIVLLALPLLSIAQNPKEPDVIATKAGDLTVYPISHATMVMELNGFTMYFDPNGGKAAFEAYDAPDVIFITDIHGDHLNQETLKELKTTKTTFVVPQAVADQLGDIDYDSLIVMANGDTATVKDHKIVAVPMYNLPEAPDSRHPKGRGNGYILELGGKRVYISGDTEGVPEVRNLQNIDVAFLSMNLPYTMDVEQAASTTLDFKPAVIYPYHFRGKDGLSDVEQFKQLVNAKNEDIQVRLKDWYPEKEEDKKGK